MHYRKPEELKESKIEWHPKLPKGWDEVKVSYLFHLGRGRVISQQEIMDNKGDYPVYSSQTGEDGVLGHIDTYDFEGDYITWTTDGAHAGTVFRRKGKFNCTNVCGTLDPTSKDAVLDYLHYAISIETKRFVREDINPKLMNNQMAAIRIIYPSKPEQRAIAAFLDRKTETIDRLVEKKELLIERINEKRQALITQAVTKGLSPDTLMKDSGIEWLGEVPEEWSFKSLKFAVNINAESLSEDENPEKKIRYIDSR